MLITSREHGWREIAVPVEVDVLARPESVMILRDRVAGLSGADADRLAARLGDLPLAVTQAAAFMIETAVPTDQYLTMLERQTTQLLDQTASGSYPQSLATATQLIADQLAADDPAAAELAWLCAFLGPEPIPEDLFTNAPGELPRKLAAQVADPVAWRVTLRHLGRQSLARVDKRGLVMHRLTQAILRDYLTPAEATDARARSEAMVAASNPSDPANPVTWRRWAQLMPHLLASCPADTSSSGLRSMACEACSYLLDRGDIRAGHDLAADLHQHWRERLGDNDESTLAAAHRLAWALQGMGRYAEACDLDQNTLDRRRRVLGPDHYQTLISAHSLARGLRLLGEVEVARDLDQDTRTRRHRVLGPDHYQTL